MDRREPGKGGPELNGCQRVPAGGYGEGGAARGECGRGAGRGECGRVLRAASVGRTLSPPASVVVLLKSDFLAYYC